MRRILQYILIISALFFLNATQVQASSIFDSHLKGQNKVMPSSYKEWDRAVGITEEYVTNKMEGYYWGDSLKDVDVFIKPTDPMAPPSSYHTVVANNKLIFHQTGTAPQEDGTYTLDLKTGNLSFRYYRYNQETGIYFWAIEETTPQGKFTVYEESTGKVIETGFNMKRYEDHIAYMEQQIEFSYTKIDSDPTKAILLKPVVDYLKMVEGKLESYYWGGALEEMVTETIDPDYQYHKIKVSVAEDKLTVFNQEAPVPSAIAVYTLNLETGLITVKSYSGTEYASPEDIEDYTRYINRMKDITTEAYKLETNPDEQVALEPVIDYLEDIYNLLG